MKVIAQIQDIECSKDCVHPKDLEHCHKNCGQIS